MTIADVAVYSVMTLGVASVVALWLLMLLAHIFDR